MILFSYSSVNFLQISGNKLKFDLLSLTLEAVFANETELNNLGNESQMWLIIIIEALTKTNINPLLNRDEFDKSCFYFVGYIFCFMLVRFYRNSALILFGMTWSVSIFSPVSATAVMLSNHTVGNFFDNIIFDIIVIKIGFNEAWRIN